MNTPEKVLIISDIHGNYTALESVLENVELTKTGIILLGDLIDYGPRPNEVIELLKNKIEQVSFSIAIWGNHEKAILENDFSSFSTLRGAECAKITRRKLNKESLHYIGQMNRQGKQEFYLGEYKCLAVHGSLEDSFWKSIFPENVHGDYREYDYVFSGHSHCPHTFTKFYDSNDSLYRNQKRTVFINPGAVGQPRNHNFRAAYALLDVESGAIELQNVRYDVKAEQELYGIEIDNFYKIRLERGI